MAVGLQCIVMFGATTTETFQKITTYITSMETKQTTDLRTLNCSSSQNTQENMDTEETNTPNQPNNETMHSNNSIVPYISLCSGYEGIGLGLHRCIPNLRCVAYCEREAFAIANLVAKMESGLLDAAPVFTDVTNFPWADYAPYMAGGILSFGWPCQPVSCAGKRKATEDERWLFDIIADGISILRPGMLFAENVEGLLSARMPDGSSVFGHCIERLESLHYKVAAGIFSASEVGAPHQRKRVFILAVSNSLGGAAGLSRSLAGHEGFAGVSDNGGSEGCLANSNDQHGHGEERGGSPEEDRISSEHREEEHSRRELRRADAAGGEGCGELADSYSDQPSAERGDAGEVRGLSEAQRQPEHGAAVFGGGCLAGATAWPSRPGEPQHGWEPPRVVGNAPQRQDHGRESRDMGIEAGQGRCGDHASHGAGENVANHHSPHAGHGEQRAQRTHRDLSSGCGEVMGDSASVRVEGRQHDNTGGNRSGSGSQQPRGTSGDESECRQTQPALGRDADGSAGGLGYAELCVATDNRTDELRLLGNGVVPATAERAFRFLWHEIIQSVE